MKTIMKRTCSLLIVLLLLLGFSGCAKGYEPAPQITEGEFPFVLEYEWDGQRYLMEDTVVCAFDGYDLSDPFPFLDYSRTWHESLKSGEEKRVLIEFAPHTASVLVKDRINEESRLLLSYGDGGYYLGDPENVDDGPCIWYVEDYKISENTSEVKATSLTNEQLEEYFGVKVIRFEFSEPIENTFA